MKQAGARNQRAPVFCGAEPWRIQPVLEEPRDRDYNHRSDSKVCA